MSKTETLYCDICKKKTNHLNNILILFSKGEKPSLLRGHGDKYQAIYDHEVCDKCLGSSDYHCWGNTPHTSIADKGMNFLKRFLKGDL